MIFFEASPRDSDEVLAAWQELDAAQKDAIQKTRKTLAAAPSPPQAPQDVAGLVARLMADALPWIDRAYAKPSDPEDTPFYFHPPRHGGRVPLGN